MVGNHAKGDPYSVDIRHTRHMNSKAQKIIAQDLEFTNHMAHEVLDGLLRSPKRILPKYFYDPIGSALFDTITELDEYYIPRVEQNIFECYKSEICEDIGKQRTIVEPGAGSCEKIKWLLPELEPATYVPMDISGSHLHENAANLRSAHAKLTVNPLVFDHTNGLSLGNILPDTSSVFFYPGSSIGNFEPLAAVDFMRKLRMNMGNEGGLLIGVDTKKDNEILHAAYNDHKGATAAFNINVLSHLNHLFEGNLDPSAFEHVAFYSEEHGRIEMHLRCVEDHNAFLAGVYVNFYAGELINTEYSYKYHPDEFSVLAQHAGLHMKRLWQDECKHFSVMYFAPGHNGVSRSV
jgi:dimethylhistidine N-methyltransferase